MHGNALQLHFSKTQRELEPSTELRKKVESCVENTTNVHHQGTGDVSLKVEGFLRPTGFFELLVGVLIRESEPPIPQCPGSGCGVPFDYGLYNTVSLVFVVIGLIQIAASFYIAHTHSPTQHAMANPAEAQ
jgi:hypothetical protein